MRPTLTALIAAFVLAFSVLTAAGGARAEEPVPAEPPEPPEPPGTRGGSIQIIGDSGGGDEGEPAAVIARLPPDVRARLTGDQVEQIIRRSQEAETAGLASTVVPGLFFFTILGVVVALQFARFRRERQLHDTLRAMIEKGVEIPPALIVPDKPKANDRRRGFILVSLGVGLSACLYAIDESKEAWALGIVPLLLGVGYLVAFFVEQRDA